MNHATRFYNTIKMMYKDDPELFSLMIKEFDSVIRNHLYIPSCKYTNAVFNDNSALTTINGKSFISSNRDEFMDYTATLFEEHPNLKDEYMKELDARL